MQTAFAGKQDLHFADGSIAGVAQRILRFDVNGVRRRYELYANLLFRDDVAGTERHGAGGSPERAATQEDSPAKAGVESRRQSNLIVASNGHEQKSCMVEFRAWY